MHYPFRFVPLLGSLLLLLSACQSTLTQKQKEHVFYPQPPDAPRLQFLTSYSTEGDLGSASSRFEEFVAGKRPDQKPIGKPYGLALQASTLYVCDLTANSIDILDLKERSFRYFTPEGEGALLTPINIAVDTGGTRYVTDTARGQVLIYSKDDRFLGAIGERNRSAKPSAHSKAGIAPEQNDSPDAIKPTDVLLSGDRLFVSDLKGHCIRVYDKAKRELLYTIPRKGAKEVPESRLLAPVNIAKDGLNRLYVSDLASFRVLQFDPEGHYLRNFGLGAGDKPGEFVRPKGIAVDRENRVYVVDAATQLVQIFDDQNRLLLFFGGMVNKNPGLDLPAKIIIDYDHVSLFQSFAAPDFQVEYLVLVTSQFGGNKVSVFGFGHSKH